MKKLWKNYEQESAAIYKTSKDFWDCYHNLSPELQQRANKSFALLKQDPKHPSLSFKKVGKEIWSARISRDYRALARKEEGVFVWYWIGKHDEYKRQIQKLILERNRIIMDPPMEYIQTYILHDQDGIDNYMTHIHRNGEGWIGQIEEMPEVKCEGETKAKLLKELEKKLHSILEIRADAWDKQIEQDIKAGSLDHLGDKAIEELREKKCIDL